MQTPEDMFARDMVHIVNKVTKLCILDSSIFAKSVHLLCKALKEKECVVLALICFTEITVRGLI